MGNHSKPHNRFTEYDVTLFQAGKHFQLYEKLGAHPMYHDGQAGVHFAVYAPAAKSVQLIGDFNNWNGSHHELFVHWDGSGIWEGFIPGLQEYELYKYRIWSHHDDVIREKQDPFGFATETPPKTASVVNTLNYKWQNKNWLQRRSNKAASPMSIYELHLGSWMQKNAHESLSYRDLADDLVTYVKDMGFTHVEFLPVMEHPYYPSWGYLCTSFFAPSNRYGPPTDLMYLIDRLHQSNIAVILDWVPSHFPEDEFALADFDGSKLYEHPDRQKGFHPDWNSLIFNYERPEVRSFLISSAHFWLDQYKVDGLRVDAVASMLYLDYSREEGEWTPNEHGGNHNLAAIEFLKDLNTSCYNRFPGIDMFAEESTSFDGVTRPVHHGGLGFGYKWMMGWMNDTLQYMERDAIHRQYHHDEISQSMLYAYSEQYLLPLSHDEVVHGKQSLLSKMPGDEWQKFANLRLLLGFMYTHPYPKLLFMGAEIGSWSEWTVNDSIDWSLLDQSPHQGIQSLVKDLNALLKSEEPLWASDRSPDGFEWIDHSDHQNSILCYYRKHNDQHILVIANFTPNTLTNYRVGVNEDLVWIELLNTDDTRFGGTGCHTRELRSVSVPFHGRPHSVSLTIAPLAIMIFKPEV